MLVVLLGNANKLGNKEASQYTTNDKFAVVTGILNNSGVNVGYPTGFTKDNCCILSVATQNPSNMYWSTGTVYDSSSYVRGGLPIQVTLKTDDIDIRAKNINLTNESTPYVGDCPAYNFKIVLMKTE